jgi:hypothetical protein
VEFGLSDLEMLERKAERKRGLVGGDIGGIGELGGPGVFRQGRRSDCSSDCAEAMYVLPFHNEDTNKQQKRSSKVEDESGGRIWAHPKATRVRDRRRPGTISEPERADLMQKIVARAKKGIARRNPG